MIGVHADRPFRRLCGPAVLAQTEEGQRQPGSEARRTRVVGDGPFEPGYGLGVTPECQQRIGRVSRTGSPPVAVGLVLTSAAQSSLLAFR